MFACPERRQRFLPAACPQPRHTQLTTARGICSPRVTGGLSAQQSVRVMQDVFKNLAAPFPSDRVSWRVGSTNRRKFDAGQAQQRKGQALAYIDARDVMERFDEVLGPGNWQCEYMPMPNGTTCCRIGLWFGGQYQWIWKSNGAGATGDTSKESEREMAEKGAYSDAFKRAAVLWGVGRYLYDLDSPWVELDEWWGIPKEAHTRLKALLNGEKPKSAYEARRDGEYPSLESGLRACTSLEALAAFWKSNQEAIIKLPVGWQQSLTAEKDRIKAALKDVKKEAA